MKVRNRFSPRNPVYAPVAEPGEGAKQSFKDECDINLIMAKFQKTGMITHVNRHEGVYGEVPAMSYLEAMETVRHANEMFATVPAAVRQKFGNDPAAFLRYVEDPENADDLRKLGLAKPVTVRAKDSFEILSDKIQDWLDGKPRKKADTTAEPSGTVAS